MSNTIDFASELGVDFACVTDLDADLSLVDGQTALLQSCARRITTPRGGLFYDANYGIDVRDFLKQSGFSETQAARIIEQELLKDERMLNAVAAVTLNQIDETVTINIEIESDAGPFTLTITVTNLTVELLASDVEAP